MSNYFALLIGVANYPNISKLPKAVLMDAVNIRDALVDPGKCNYQNQDVICLLDENATKRQIFEALLDLSLKTDENSTVFVYYSGHGARIVIGEFSGPYLLPFDTSCDSDSNLAKTSISGAEFTEAIRKIKVSKLLVIFDCCHAGGIGTPKNFAGAIKDGLPEKFYDQLGHGNGRVIIASSREDEVSWLFPNDTNSLFTKYLLSGLKGAAASQDGIIRVFNLFEYVQSLVTQECSKQHPIFKAELENNFPVAIISRENEKELAYRAKIELLNSNKKYFIFPKSTFKFGMAKKENVPEIDLTLRLLPSRNKQLDIDNWNKSALISKIHGQIRVIDNHIELMDLSRNGIYIIPDPSLMSLSDWFMVNDTPFEENNIGEKLFLKIPKNQWVKLPDQFNISIGKDILQLGVRAYHDSDNSVSSVKIQRISNTIQHEYLQLTKRILIGSSTECAIDVNTNTTYVLELSISDGQYYYRHIHLGEIKSEGDYQLISPGDILEIGNTRMLFERVQDIDFTITD